MFLPRQVVRVKRTGELATVEEVYFGRVKVLGQDYVYYDRELEAVFPVAPTVAKMPLSWSLVGASFLAYAVLSRVA